jgi:phosphinothricin acetyltransferase
MIRKIEYRDLKVVNDIYNQAVQSKYQTAETELTSLEYRRDWHRELQAGNYPVFVFEEEGEVAGWISLSEYRKGRRALRYTAEISFYILKDKQGRGIGTRLLDYMIGQARKLNIKTLIAILLEPNTPSIRLLEKFNFEKWGDMPNVADFEGMECNHQYYGLRIAE